MPEQDFTFARPFGLPSLLAPAHHLRNLNLDDLTHLSAADCAAIAACTRLWRLRLLIASDFASDQDIGGALRCLTRLRSLTLGFQPHDLGALAAALTRLTSLSITSAMPYQGQHPALPGAQRGVVDSADLAPLRNLRELWLGRHAVLAGGLRQLPALADLTCKRLVPAPPSHPAHRARMALPPRLRNLDIDTLDCGGAFAYCKRPVCLTEVRLKRLHLVEEDTQLQGGVRVLSLESLLWLSSVAGILQNRLPEWGADRRLLKLSSAVPLHGTTLARGHVVMLGMLSSLRPVELRLRGLVLEAADLHTLVDKMPQLKRLFLADCDWQAPALVALVAHPGLEGLDLQLGRPAGAEALQAALLALALGLPALQAIQLSLSEGLQGGEGAAPVIREAEAAVLWVRKQLIAMRRDPELVALEMPDWV